MRSYLFRGQNPYYGWIIVTSSFLVVTFTYGVQYSFGVFITPLQDDFEWTRAMISWVPGLYMVFVCLFGLASGLLTDKVGPRIIVSIAGFFIGLGFVLTSVLSAPWQIYIFYSLMVGLGTGFAGTPVFATTSRWFFERRGLVLGIVATGIGVGTIIFAPLAEHLISAHGWRTACLILGCCIWFVIIGSAQFLRKQPPQVSIQYQSGESDDQSPAGLTLTGALRTRNLWLLFVLYTLAFTGLLMIMYHLVAHAEDLGVSEATAAALLSAVGIASIIGRIPGGIASDKMGRRRVLAFFLILQAAMMLWLIEASSTWTLYLFAVIWGFGYGGWAPIMPAIVGEMFGLRHIASILGMVSASMGIGGFAGPALAGYIFTARDSYSIAFGVGAAAMLLSAMLVFFLKTPVINNGQQIADK